MQLVYLVNKSDVYFEAKAEQINLDKLKEKGVLVLNNKQELKSHFADKFANEPDSFIEDTEILLDFSNGVLKVTDPRGVQTDETEDLKNYDDIETYIQKYEI